MIFIGILQLAILPHSFNNLLTNFQLSISMFLSIFPLPFKYFTIAKIKNSFSMFESIKILTFIHIPIWPFKDSISFNQPIFPLSIILPVVVINKLANSMKITLFELALINPRMTKIFPFTLFYAIIKLSFIF